MRTSFKVSRAIQLVGVLLLLGAMMSCSASGFADGSFKAYLGFGLVLILLPRLYEWFSKE